jgi:ribosomal protein L37AE/L43A
VLGSASGRPALAPDLANAAERTVRALTEDMSVRQLADGRYAVDSQSGATYVVDYPESWCSCPDHQIRGVRCKHVRRVGVEIATERLPAPDQRSVQCAVCGTEIFVSRDAAGPFQCADCALSRGETVLDRETGQLLVVTDSLDRRADEVEVAGGDWTVATYPTNWWYTGDQPVVAAIFAGDAARTDDPRRYLFPRSRLERRPDLHAPSARQIALSGNGPHARA